MSRLHRAGPLLVLAVATLRAGPATADVPRQETHAYAGTSIGATCGGDPHVVDVAGTCFALDGTESQFQLAIHDDHLDPVGGRWQFYDGDHQPVGGPTTFCAATPTAVPIPPTATKSWVLWVWIQSDTLNPLAWSCNPGTTGTVTATFS